MEKEIKILLALVLLALLCSCKKWVDLQPPKDRVIADRVFLTEAKATAALTAVYGAMINSSATFANGSLTLYPGLSADELLKWNPSPAESELAEARLSAENANTAALWRSAYQVIYQTNAILEGLDASSAIGAPVKARLEGETRLVRALAYFYLVNLYGDVPLVTGTAYTGNATLPRTGAATVLDWITTELKTAKERLPETYPGAEKNRPNKWAAAALLARLYLYRQDWAVAETEATAVIEAGTYTPLPALDAVFLKNSREAVWQLSPTNGLLRETAQLRPQGSPAAPQYYLAPSLMLAWEPGDGRRTRWIDSLTYLGTKYYYPAKYRNTTSTVTEYYTVLRLAELYLVRAEARMHLGRIPDAVADINTVRQRAGLPALLTTIGLPQAALALEQERRVELMAEWGHRWFDLKRWNRAAGVLSPLKPAWTPSAVLYPVPKEEIDNNRSLTQNPGY
jgi:hypothetical protein